MPDPRPVTNNGTPHAHHAADAQAAKPADAGQTAPVLAELNSHVVAIEIQPPSLRDQVIAAVVAGSFSGSMTCGGGDTPFARIAANALDTAEAVEQEVKRRADVQTGAAMPDLEPQTPGDGCPCKDCAAVRDRQMRDCVDTVIEFASAKAREFRDTAERSRFWRSLVRAFAHIAGRAHN